MADKLHDDAISRAMFDSVAGAVAGEITEVVSVPLGPVAVRHGQRWRWIARTPKHRRERLRRLIQSVSPVYRWVCPCQDPPFLLATCGPDARLNVNVRDRYWHIQGFGMVEAICPVCAAEHILDMRLLRRAFDRSTAKEIATKREAASAE